MIDIATVKPLQPGQHDDLVQWLTARPPNLVGDGPSIEDFQRRLGDLTEDRCVLAVLGDGRYVGAIALDPFTRRVIACYLDAERATAATPSILFKALENRALAYGLRSLHCCARPEALPLLQQIGFSTEPEQADDGLGLAVSKDLTNDAAAWQREVFETLDALGIDEGYGPRHRLDLVQDCQQLVSIGLDAYDREQTMAADAADAWHRMQESASRNGVRLQVVSAFRSLRYQTGIIQAKLDKGQHLKQILAVSAAPGFSEHHSGRALDLKSPGEPPLEESFAQTKAYRWLSAKAHFFGFRESFGQANRHGLVWEPWHWCYHPHG